MEERRKHDKQGECKEEKRCQKRRRGDVSRSLIQVGLGWGRAVGCGGVANDNCALHVSTLQRGKIGGIKKSKARKE